MASKRTWCSVLGCNNEHSSRFDVPKSEPLKTQWLSFVFEGNSPPDQPQFSVEHPPTECDFEGPHSKITAKGPEFLAMLLTAIMVSGPPTVYHLYPQTPLSLL